MKLSQASVEVEQSANLEQSRFQIAMTPMAMELLSNKVYSDPILAPVREYIANAVDAYKMSGVKRPIDVTVPTTLDPTWSVRDYGPGLSKADIMGTEQNGYQGLFNTYFMSNKTGTNTQIGGFGLGCKSGFAYVKRDGAFTVTSYHNGRKLAFTCHRNEQGFPAVTLMSDTVSEEPSGVLVSIPVDYEDIGKFVDRTLSVLTFCEADYNLLGTEATPNHPTVHINGKGWFTTGGKTRPYIIIGGIAYPISTDKFEHKYRIVLTEGLHIFAPIGAVDLAVSREALSYENNTIPYITQRIDQIKAEASDLIEQKIMSQENLWEASKEYYKGRATVLFDGRKVKYRGRPLLYKNGTSTVHSFMCTKQDVLPFYIISNTLPKPENFRPKPKGWSGCATVRVQYKDLFVFFNDESIIRKKVYSIYTSGMNKDYSNIYLVRNLTPYQIKRMVVKLGRHHTYIKAEDIVDVPLPKQKRTKAVDMVRNVRRFNYRSGYYVSKNFYSASVDFADTTTTRYYVWSSTYDILTSKGNKLDHQFVEDLVNKLPPNAEVFCIPKIYAKYVKGKANWINVVEEKEKELDALLAKPQARDIITTVDTFKGSAFGDWLVKFYEDNSTKLSGTFVEPLYNKAKKVASVVSKSNEEFSEKVKELAWELKVELTPGKLLFTQSDVVVEADLYTHLPIMEGVRFHTLSQKQLDNLVDIVVKLSK